MKKIVGMSIALLVVSVFYYPLVSEAAFWDWFKKTPKSDTKVELQSTTSLPQKIGAVESTSTKETVIERIIERQVADPSVVAENISLKAQIETLKARLAQCKATDTSSSVSSKSTSTPPVYSEYEYQKSIREAQNKVNEPVKKTVYQLQQEILDIKSKYYKDVESIMSNSYYSGGAREGKVKQITDQANLDINKINLQIEQIQLDSQKNAPSNTKTLPINGSVSI